MKGSVALVLGAKGQLGGACMAASPSSIKVTPLSRKACDLTDRESLSQCIDIVEPKWIINAAAYTSVDAAENDTDQAAAVNTAAPAVLAAICAQRGIRLVHVSTDFVFDGMAKTPYLPSAKTSPLGVYGETKLGGERAVIASGASHVIIRTSWLYAPGGRNFVLTMLRLMRDHGGVRVVSDQIGSPTSASGLAKVCWALALHPEASGIFHWSDFGAISWYEFACAIREESISLGLLPESVWVKPIQTVDYPTAAERPAYSVLDAQFTCDTLAILQRPWREALTDMLRSLLVNSAEESDG